MASKNRLLIFKRSKLHIYNKFRFGPQDKMEPQPDNFLSQQGPSTSQINRNQQRLNQNPQAQFITLFSQQQIASTYRDIHFHDDITIKKVYILNNNILDGTLISQNMRARIRSFLMNEGSKQWAMRDTLALACTYIDLYFKRQGFCAVQEFQAMAIGCLILAMKMQEGKFPTISFNVFNKEELLSWEKKVIKRLEYQISPPTYISIGQHVAIKWEVFIQKESNFNKPIIECHNGVNFVLRRFYEQLDCIFMVLRSLSWQLQSLVINLFYLHVRMINLFQLIDPHLLNSKEFAIVFYPSDEFTIFFQKFLRGYSHQKTIKLDQQLGVFLKNFLSMQPSVKEFPIKKSLQNLRIWDKLQTFPKDCYTMSKSIMEKSSPTKKK